MNTYLFDFDGTLVDSMPTYVAVMLRILDEEGIAYGDDIIKTITPLGYLGTAKHYKTLGVALSVEEIVAKMNAYAYEEYAHRIEAKPHVVQALKSLKAQGADLNVLTASPHRVLDPCLRRLGLYDMFTNVWSCDDFGTTKADPQIYHMAASRIGIPIGEILFLDDNYHADRTAKEAGMQVCGVYDPSSEEYREQIQSIADRYIYDFSELLK